MKYLIILFILVPVSAASANELLTAINRAAKKHQVPADYLRRIAMVESSGRVKVKDRINRNGTRDVGPFQINTINWHRCAPLDIRTVKGNALCAARLVKRLRPKSLYDLAKYHSKTPKHRNRYYQKLLEVK